MDKKSGMNRREMLKAVSITGLAAGAVAALGSTALAENKVLGTPMQFTPANGPDSDPSTNDIEKYPKCVYCGMSRKMWNHSRHLIQYSDDLIDPVCSLHCVAVSLALNIDRAPKAIYAGDFGAESKIKPLVNVDQATYLVNSKLKGTMAKESKMAFGSHQKAKITSESHGGQLKNFNDALTRAYLGMAKDVAMIRKKRASKRKNTK